MTTHDALVLSSAKNNLALLLRLNRGWLSPWDASLKRLRLRRFSKIISFPFHSGSRTQLNLFSLNHLGDIIISDIYMFAALKIFWSASTGPINGPCVMLVSFCAPLLHEEFIQKVSRPSICFCCFRQSNVYRLRWTQSNGLLRSSYCIYACFIVSYHELRTTSTASSWFEP